MDAVQEANDLLQRLEFLTENPSPEVLGNDSLRTVLRDAARNLSISLETSGDTVHRLGNAGLQQAMAMVGHDANIFKTLADADVEMSLESLAAKTNGEPALLKRLLRYYQSMRMVSEVLEDQFKANNVTKALAAPVSAGVAFYSEVANPAFWGLREYLKSHGYKAPTNPMDSPWHVGHHEPGHPWVWFQNHPRQFRLFNTWMALTKEGLPTWLDCFPFEKEVGMNATPDSVLFVDIGGAFGHQSIELRERFPDLPGRVIIQDLPHVIADRKPPHGIEAMAYDFFTPQPVHGARAYYMRFIMHDHGDELCRQILKNTIAAMTDDSVLLIDDMVLPETGAAWRATQVDIAMMTILAAAERTKKQLVALLDSVDLDIVKIWRYSEEVGDSIIVAKRRVKA